jgi:2-polyprenyl-6-methoxyphenol hydroxylase-like FAD-dependent oxidoreductase
MSPIGGVGINLAIQDAVAGANVLWRELTHGSVDVTALAAVQRRREWPTRLTQRIQLFIQDRVAQPVLQRTRPLPAPWPLLLLRRFPYLRRIPARLIGIGVRPEHVATPLSG